VPPPIAGRFYRSTSTEIQGLPVPAVQISRTLKRLRLHGLIKKIGRMYLYYLTGFGKQVIVICLKLKNMFLIPELSRGRIFPAKYPVTFGLNLRT
jgi:hypothetical protein